MNQRETIIVCEGLVCLALAFAIAFIIGVML
jgi:hypothetical protein